MPVHPLRVVLVNMPFSTSRAPSIQLGLLHSILEKRGIPACQLYLNLRFGERIGWELFERLCWQRCDFVGDWIFAPAAFGDQAPAAQLFLDRYESDIAHFVRNMQGGVEQLLDLRNRVAPAFIEEQLAAVDWDACDVVGFGTAFEQNCAALAMARRIKEKFPRIVTVFGGANMDGDMGIEMVRSFPCIDYGVIGEGDEAFPALLDCLASGGDIARVRGVARRDADGKVQFGGHSPMVLDMDGLPTPDYRDFFAQMPTYEMPRNIGRYDNLRLVHETARGCWWGAKHHCTFCGLNGNGMKFRSKSPGRVLEELEELHSRHGITEFEATDNILDHRYVKDVFTVLAEQRRGFSFFFEVKSNLFPEQLEAMAAGGLRQVQPGIESLDTHMLQLMRKGTTGIQNVRFLKWAHYFGMAITWNVLCGYPGETREDYANQLRIFDLIPHLPPPIDSGRILAERFAPYFDKAEEFGITILGPKDFYKLIYPPHVDLMKIAYFFEYDAPRTLSDDDFAETFAYVDAWQETWAQPWRPFLYYEMKGTVCEIADGRNIVFPRHFVFDGAAAAVYDYCSVTYHSVPQILKWLQGRDFDADEASVRTALDAFVADGLMMEEGGNYLSLAYPLLPNRIFATGVNPEAARARLRQASDCTPATV